MNWLAKLNGDPLPWLLEPDPANPGVRYLTLRDLLDRPADDPELRQAQADVMSTGTVRAILDAQAPDGFWDKPGAGYGPKYTGTVWSVIFLAMFGADGRDPAVRRGCDYVLDHSRARAPYGGFTAVMELYPAGQVQCLGGNLCAALIDLGWRDDPRLIEALAWLARSITGEGIVPADEAPPRGTKPGEDEVVRYFKGGISGPGFECAANSRKPCAWGAIKALLALSRVPSPARTPTMQKAIAQGVDFLLSRDPVTADYPTPDDRPPSRSWFQLGYPLGYVTDVLQNLEALVALGRGDDPRLANALAWLLAKQDAAGRWKMEYTYNGKLWQDVERKGQPSKWVTLRALRVLKRAA
jgi:hypothetical protein